MITFDLNAISSRSKKKVFTVEEYLRHRKSIDTYLDITSNVNPSDPNFQKLFSKFYGLNAARGMNKNNFYNVFKDFYNHNKYVCYRNILKDLKNLIIGTGRVEASFGSKILHTIDGDEPIIDKIVLGNLQKDPNTSKFFVGLIKKSYTIDEAVDLHNALKACYVDYLIPYAKSKSYFANFDRKFSNATYISEVKKIDFYLWTM